MNSRQALLLAIGAVLLFSSAPAGVRAVSLNAYGLGILRLGLASAVMTAFLAWRRQRPWRWNRRAFEALVIVGLTFGIHWMLFFLSIKTASAAIGALGQSTYGLHLIVLGWLLGFGTVTLIDIISLLLGLVGTWLLMPVFDLQNDQTLGLLFGISGGLAAASLPLWHQRYADVDGNLRAWGQFTFALPVFFCCLPWATWDIPTSDIPLILYLGLVVTLVGHGLWVHASTALSTTTTSIVSYLYLPSALVLSYFLLGEKLSGKMLVGALCVFVANGVALWSQARRGGLAAIARNVEND
ncbi:MAG: DMT family transporter [Pirellulales bacterium]|nr:DMT family transporter [Pirellulales bacterium]